MTTKDTSSSDSTNKASSVDFDKSRKLAELDNFNTYSLRDPGPNAHDVARRLGLVVPDVTGAESNGRSKN